MPPPIFWRMMMDIQITIDDSKWRSEREQEVIDLVMEKLRRKDLVGLENTLRNRTLNSLRKRGVVIVRRKE